jgi:archaellum component FlaC
MDMMLEWNILLSLLVGVIGWFLKDKATELQRVQILLNRTREEIAKEYVTKAEVHTDINRVMNRLEVLDAKLDRLMEHSAK